MKLPRVLATVAALAVLGVPAQAYYHYVYFSSRGGPYTPINARFDLTKLTNNTVVFSVVDSGPATFYPNDSFGSVLGEIKQAIASWNAVPNSSLHLAFGGLETSGQSANTPGGDVVFQDLGPGLLGLASPNLPATPQFTTASGSTFVPITRSTVVLTNNTSSLPGPSYKESFFTTVVHELGHAVGLQHTWTSSAMAQAVVRNTSRARPVDADDIAGFLDLYGTTGWTSNYGSISGKVTFATGGAGVALASVVAIPATGPAVSALTNPDGSYTINGLPPGTYYLYVHPLPPDAIVSDGTGLVLPQDASGTSIAASSTTYRAMFYPGTFSASQASQLTLIAGTSLSGQNFSVQTRTGSLPAYDLQVYSYADAVNNNYAYNPTTLQWIQPAFLNVSNGAVEFDVQADSGSVTVPQSVTILGIGTASSCKVSNTFPCFNSFGSPTELAGYFSLSSASGTGPRHLLFNYSNDMYLLPDGVVLVQQGPPYISAVTSNGDGTVTVSGGNFGPDSRVFFDSLQTTGTVNGTSSITVTPPSGQSGQVSTVTVFNSDGQNSMLFLSNSSAPTYSYSTTATAAIASLTPSVLSSGNSGTPYSTMLDITAVNTNFVDGQVSVGSGSSDILVNRVWVVSPSHLMADVSVASGAAIGASELSVLSGFQVMTAWLQTQGPNGVLPLISGVLSTSTALPTLYRGGYGAVYGSNLQAAAAAQATLNGTPVTIQYSSSNQVNFAVPSGAATGPATLTLSNGSATTNLVVPIGATPPTIVAVASSQGTTVDAGHAASVGDVLTVTVNGIDPTSTPALSRLQVTVSGLPMTVQQISLGANSQYQIQFVLTQSFAGSQVPLVVSLDSSPSAAYTIAAH